MLTHMHVRELYDSPASPPPTYATGLADLDRLTGGGPAPGQLWVVTGAPGQGRTMLAVQLAVQMAVEHQVPVHLGCARERPDRARARLLSVATRRPIDHPSTMLEHHQVQLARLLASRLDVEAGGGGLIGDPFADAPTGSARCWIVDDADRGGLFFIDELRRAADRGTVVLATVPRDGLVGERGVLVGPWGAAADVVLDLDLNHGHRDGVHRDPDVMLLLNRFGPVAPLEWTASTYRGFFSSRHPEAAVS